MSQPKRCTEHRSVQPGCQACLASWGVLLPVETVDSWVRANELILLAPCVKDPA